MKRFLPWSALKVWLVLSAMFVSSRSQAQVKDKSCQATCGDIQIPYPFGIGENCSLSESFSLDCNSSNSNEPQLFTAGVELESINLESSQVQALASMSYKCSDIFGRINNSTQRINLNSTPFQLSNEENVFIGVGCDTLAFIFDSGGTNLTRGCITWCSSKNNVDNGSCSGTGCCQTSIQPGIRNYILDFDTVSKYMPVLEFNRCSYGFIVKKNYYNFTTSDLEYMDPNQKFPLELDWAIGSSTCEEAQRNKVGYACVAENSDCSNSVTGSGYVCKCYDGYRGNPYLQNGCQDIDECKEGIISCKGDCVNTNGSYTCTCPPGTSGNATGDGCFADNNGFSMWAKLGLGIGIGLPLLFIIGSWISWEIQKRKLAKLKEDFFRQNGGLFLQEQISTNQVDTFQIYSLVEMEKATQKFNEEMVLGKGGNGIVYKGLLQDGTTVAIKKSMVVEASKTKEFANEMLILSKINHVNVVKLLGCCLEVEVPMLVYEYIPNGTLFQHIYSHEQDNRLPWDVRLRIGAQSAKALSYLHSEAHPPILHGDIKSCNILLGDNLTAKVSDFGTSTFAPKDKSRFMTLIQGTYGYLDPEYLHTGELTDKSDVYSFGVVMVELLTGKQPIYFDEEKNNEKNLGFEFVSCMKEGRLVDILDPHIMDDKGEVPSNSSIEEIKLVADIAMQCLSVTGKERPTMTQVNVVLEGLSRSKRHVQLNIEEEEYSFEVQQPVSSSNLETDEYPLTKTTTVEMMNIGSGR